MIGPFAMYSLMLNWNFHGLLYILLQAGNYVFKVYKGLFFLAWKLRLKTVSKEDRDLGKNAKILLDSFGNIRLNTKCKQVEATPMLMNV